jgi:hypothetical protein
LPLIRKKLASMKTPRRNWFIQKEYNLSGTVFDAVLFEYTTEWERENG